MPEYIEREAAIRAVKRRFSMPVDNLIAEVIGNVPVVDVEPVRHGRWIWHENDECYICSNCRNSALNNFRMLSTDSPFCPNCGAKMDLEVSHLAGLIRRRWERISGKYKKHPDAITKVETNITGSRPLTIIVLAVSVARARSLLLELCEENKDQMESWMQGVVPEPASRRAKMRDGTRFIAMSCGADPNLLEGLIADEVFYEAAVWDRIPALLLARLYMALDRSPVPRELQWHKIG